MPIWTSKSKIVKYKVLISEDAQKDLFGIYEYIAEYDAPEKAEQVYENIKKTCSTLKTIPKRGRIPPELKRISVLNYYEIRYKPYRIIYEISGKEIFIHFIFDGRRDIQETLEQRLFR